MDERDIKLIFGSIGLFLGNLYSDLDNMPKRKLFIQELKDIIIVLEDLKEI